MSTAQRVDLLFFCLCLSLTLLFPAVPRAEAASTRNSVSLLKPDTGGGKPLLEALALRKSTRNFSDRPLAEQDLSNLLWAAWGVNRPGGGHTVPTSMNKRNVRVYAVMENGVWLYEPEKHELKPALAEDERSTFGGAPLTLIYAAEDGYYASGMHVGSMYQNVGLYCASAGLGNVVKRSGVDALDGRLPLPEGYRVYIVQSVGWPR